MMRRPWRRCLHARPEEVLHPAEHERGVVDGIDVYTQERARHLGPLLGWLPGYRLSRGRVSDVPL